jgi:hypothetical protein
MRRRDFVLVIAAAALASCQRQPGADGAPSGEEASPSIPDPAEAIQPLYAPYMTEGAQFPQFRDQAPWSADLWVKLEAMLARSAAINEPILDFDPVIGAQDGQVSALAVTTDGVVANSHATVRAHFINLGREEEIVYDLVWENGAWRVDNIRSAEWDLRRIITQGATLP